MKHRFGRLFVVTGTTIHILWLLAGVYLAGRATILTILGVSLLVYLGLWFRIKRVHPHLKIAGHNALQRFVRWYQKGLRRDELAQTLMILGLFIGWGVLLLRVLKSYDTLLVATRIGESNAADIRAFWLTLAGIVGPAAFFFGGRRLSQ